MQFNAFPKLRPAPRDLLDFTGAESERDAMAFLLEHQVIAVSVGELHEIAELHVALRAVAQVVNHGLGYSQLVG